MVGHPEPPILGFIEWLIENGYVSLAEQFEESQKPKPNPNVGNAMLADLSGMFQDWEDSLKESDCPFNLANWTGILAACIFCAATVEASKPTGNSTSH